MQLYRLQLVEETEILAPGIYVVGDEEEGPVFELRVHERTPLHWLIAPLDAALERLAGS